MNHREPPIVYPREVDGILPPFDDEAEVAVIGALMHEHDLIDRIPNLRPEHFYSEKNRLIFATIRELAAQSIPTDQINVGSHLRDHGRLSQAGEMVYIAEVWRHGATRSAVASYANTIIDKAKRRAFIVACQRSEAEAYLDHETTTQAVVDNLSKELLGLAQDRNGVEIESFASMRRVLNDISHRANEWSARDKAGATPLAFQTGIAALDAIYRSAAPGKLTIVAGRPGHGKSVFALNHMALPWTLQPKAHALFVGIEMTNEETYLRAVAQMAEVNIAHLTEPWTMTNAEWSQITLFAQDKLRSERSLHLVYRPGVGLFELRSIVRKVACDAEQMGGTLGLVVIDYLQLLASPPPVGRRITNRFEDIGEMVRLLKMLAGEMGIAIVLLSALSRASESRSGSEKRPRMSDLAESGKIEAHADAIIMLYRPNADSEDPHKRNVSEIVIPKQRGGETGVVPVYFDGKYARFRDLEQSTPPASPPRWIAPEQHWYE